MHDDTQVSITKLVGESLIISKLDQSSITFEICSFIRFCALKGKSCQPNLCTIQPLKIL